MNANEGHASSEPAAENPGASPSLAGSQSMSDVRRDIDFRRSQSTDGLPALENDKRPEANDQPQGSLFRPTENRAPLLAELRRLTGVFEVGPIASILTESAEAIAEDAQRIPELQFELHSSLKSRLGPEGHLELSRLEVKQLEQDISGAEEELGTCSAQLEKKTHECETLAQDVKGLEAGKQEDVEKLKLASSQLEQACSDIAVIGAERTALKKELKQVGDGSQKEMDDLRERLNQKTRDHERVVEDMDRLKGEHKIELQQKVAKAKETHTEVFTQLNKVRLDNATLTAGQATSAKVVEKLKQLAEGLQAKLLAQKKELAMKNEKCDDLARDNVQLEERNAFLTHRLEEVESENQQLLDRNGSLSLWSSIVVHAADETGHALQHLQKEYKELQLQNSRLEHNEYLSALQLSYSKTAQTSLESILDSVELEYRCGIDSLQSVEDLRARPPQDGRGARAKMERWMRVMERWTRVDAEYRRLGFKKLSTADVAEDFVFPVLRIECTPSRKYQPADLNGKAWTEPTPTMQVKNDKRYKEGAIYHGRWPTCEIEESKDVVLPITPTTPGRAEMGKESPVRVTSVSCGPPPRDPRAKTAKGDPREHERRESKADAKTTKHHSRDWVAEDPRPWKRRRSATYRSPIYQW